MTRKTQAEFEAEGRQRAHDQGDPEMLVGPDLIHYTELLIRFVDHRVMSEDWQFWGHLADHYNRAMHYPKRPDWDRRVSEFNSTVAMCYGYLRMSTASREARLDLLHRYFPPPSRVQNCTSEKHNEQEN